MAPGRAVLVLLGLLGVAQVQARFFIEKGGLKIKFPTTAAQAHRDGFDMALANFGTPKYGGELLGKLIYVDKNHQHAHTCTPSCNYACQNFSEAQPPFKLNPYTNPDSPSQRTNYIMLVDRGPIDDTTQACKFALKVWNAQQAGAQGVIVVNYEDKLTTMEAPDEQDDTTATYLKNITIPAAFVTKSNGTVLKNLLKNGMSEDVHVVMDWNDVLPRAEKVDWEFWTDSNNMCGTRCDNRVEFVREFAQAARELESNYTRFTPHYIVWVCPEGYREKDECQSQCIHNGRYCTPDPDGDLLEGYNGADVVKENLRELCLFKLANESGKPWLWWDFVTKFSDQCKMVDKHFSQECAEKVFNEVNSPTFSTLAAWRSCIGDVQADVPNALMEAEMKGQRGSGDVGEVYITPTIRINHVQYRGRISYSEVLRALCAGFNKNAEPPICMRVAEDDCRVGSPGDTVCSAKRNGKTKCVNTFSGFKCVCGSGFISHEDENGKERCLNINECTTVVASDLDPQCTCDRCACKDTYGSYECVPNLPDECQADHGGCWHDDFYVNGQKQPFTACRDDIKLYKEAAAQGWKDADLPPLHSCVCPPCFVERKKGGQTVCEPKCDLDHCDLPTGVCGAAAITRGMPAWAVVVTVMSVLAAVGVGVYAAYRWRIRSAMHQEIRAIMAQYMPLESNADNVQLVSHPDGLHAPQNGTSTGHV